jgi:hypothetical protein
MRRNRRNEITMKLTPSSALNQRAALCCEFFTKRVIVG